MSGWVHFAALGGETRIDEHLVMQATADGYRAAIVAGSHGAGRVEVTVARGEAEVRSSGDFAVQLLRGGRAVARTGALAEWRLEAGDRLIVLSGSLAAALDEAAVDAAAGRGDAPAAALAAAALARGLSRGFALVIGHTAAGGPAGCA